MRYQTLYRTVLAMLPLLVSGCSSMGLSLQSRAPLMRQTSELLERAPRGVFLPRELSKRVLPDHFLQPGDGLLVETVDLESEVRLPADQRVLADGRIDLGPFGRIRVAGLTLEATEELIEKVIVDSGAEPTEVNVRMLDPIHRYYVLGEVNSPGSYPLLGYETVLDGILAGGGLTSAAAPCKILLARPTAPPSCRVTLPICYHQITQLGDTTTNYQLQPGDRIYVASRDCCDELRFWESSDTCEHCNPCQRVCLDPEVADYANPVVPISLANRLPDAEPELIGSGSDSLDDYAPENGSLDGELPPAELQPPRPQRQPQLPQPQSPRPRRIVPPAGSRDQPAPSPSRLPDGVDGELDFSLQGRVETSSRFEPMWISRPNVGS